ncbi:hypothetical protein [Marispirochaeta sp.]|uniref:hypothetical protein n=1 Tax=Marispirochaeta sp. TaxID=2038653 RepID=UPI0029C63F51|nr:hypothetical protein [Marispirochaeta sp.]
MTPLRLFFSGICIIVISIVLIQCTTVPETLPNSTSRKNIELDRDHPEKANPSETEDPQLSREGSWQTPSEKDLRDYVDRLNSNIQPVLDQRGAPLIEVWQRNNRGYAAVLCVERGEEYHYSVLSDLSRMYDQDSRQLFYVASIQGYKGEVFLAYLTELGEFPVIDRYAAGPFGRPAAPMALTIGFQTGEGEEEFILFFGEGGAESTRLRQNSASYVERRDIDGDGIQDVLLYEAIYEEGTGKETFVSWYRWNGKGLSIYKTTTIVRKLNKFLQDAAELLEGHSFDRFIDRFIIPPDKKADLQQLPFEEAFHRIFFPDRQITVHVPLDRRAFAAIRRVAFPKILENPFNMLSNEYVVELPVHFIADRDYRYSVRLLMSRNPFEDGLFGFVPRQP